MSSVFKVKRNFIEREVELSDGKKVKIKFYEPNTKQSMEIAKLSNGDGNSLSLIDLQIKILTENLQGKDKDDLIDDLMKNGNAFDFIAFIQAQIEAEKEKK